MHYASKKLVMFSYSLFFTFSLIKDVFLLFSNCFYTGIWNISNNSNVKSCLFCPQVKSSDLVPPHQLVQSPL